MENQNNVTIPVHTAMVACNLADALHYLQWLHLGNSLDAESLESLQKARELINKSHKAIIRELDI